MILRLSHLKIKKPRDPFDPFCRCWIYISTAQHFSRADWFSGAIWFSLWWILVMHGDARWCLIMFDHAWPCMIMPDLDWFPTDPYRLFNLIKYDQNGYCFWLGGVDGSGGRGFWNRLLQSLHTDWALQNGFDFFAEKQRTMYKMACSFFFMSIQSSQVGLVLQNGSVFFWGGNFHRWVYVLNNFTKGFFSGKNEKTHDFFKGTLLNGL